MRKAALVCAFATLAAVPALGADPATIDWSKIPVVSVTLFYPGQSSYEWLRTSNHPGAQPVSQGMACKNCHTGTEKTLGDKIVKGGSLENVGFCAGFQPPAATYSRAKLLS
jgi:hypothetical protein